MGERYNLLLLLLLLTVASMAKRQVATTKSLVWPTWPTCGFINSDSRLNTGHMVGLTDYPWIGRLAFVSAGGILYGKLTVLLTSRHLIATAHAVEAATVNQTLRYVLLGDWNTSNAGLTQDCDAYGYCAPPKLRQIAEIMLHPEYNPVSLSNNIAMLLLEQPVVYTSAIQPICMPPPNFMANSTIGQHLYIAGCSQLQLNNTIRYKYKKLIQVEGRQHCQRLGGIYRAEQNYCGYSDSTVELVAGSPIMRIHAQDNELHHLFLVGLLHIGSGELSLFQPIDLYRDWIERNVQMTK